MIKYKLQVGGVPITSIQYKGEPIGHLHYKGTQYSYWENPPPEPEPEPPAPPKPPTIYRLTGDSVGMTKFTVTPFYSAYVADLQVGIKASGYNYFAYQRRLDRGVWVDVSSGTPASMKAEDGTYSIKNGEITYPTTSSSTPLAYDSPIADASLLWLKLTIGWTGRRGSPALSFRLSNIIPAIYGTVTMLDYTAVATFNVNGECVSAQDTHYEFMKYEKSGDARASVQRPTLTRSGASFRVRNGAWVRLVKVSG